MKIPIAKEGLVYVKLFLGLACGFYILGRAFFSPLIYLSILFLVLTFFCLYFFRDPERKITEGDNLILSPGDGRVFEISTASDNSDFNILKIFLSIFDVHIQRAPVSGEVKSIEYKKGIFLPANDKKAFLENEQNIVEIKNGKSEIRVVQIAGIIARRIRCFVKEGESLQIGQRIGLIQFGSQVDIYLPRNVKIAVKVGDKVKAGMTIIGHRPTWENE